MRRKRYIYMNKKSGNQITTTEVGIHFALTTCNIWYINDAKSNETRYTIHHDIFFSLVEMAKNHFYNA